MLVFYYLQSRIEFRIKIIEWIVDRVCFFVGFNNVGFRMQALHKPAAGNKSKGNSFFIYQPFKVNGKEGLLEYPFVFLKYRIVIHNNILCCANKKTVPEFSGTALVVSGAGSPSPAAIKSP